MTRRHSPILSEQQSMLQALAAAGAVLIAFIGVCHEVVGGRIFPWAPEFLGVFGWHSVGIGAIAAGVGLLGGVLGVIAFPVVALSAVIAIVSVGITVFTALVHREFHLFAVTASLAGASVALLHRAGERLATVARDH